jgi:hypothetical protein
MTIPKLGSLVRCVKTHWRGSSDTFANLLLDMVEVRPPTCPEKSRETVSSTMVLLDHAEKGDDIDVGR